MSSRKERLLEYGLVAAVVLLAAWLRFRHLDHVEFLWDQAEIAKWAIRMGRHGEVALAGVPSSTGLYSFLGTTWLLAIPFALSPSPIFATGFVALLNVIAVAGCYLLTRRWFGRAAGLTAALLFAVAPWGVIYSRKLWQVEMLAPFAVLHAATGWQAFVRGRRWALVPHCLVMGWLVQIHFSAVAFVLLTAMWAVIFWRRFDWRLLLVGGLLAGLMFVPYLVFESQHDWISFRTLWGMMGQPAVIDGESLHAVWVIATGLDLYWVTGPDRYAAFAASTPPYRWLFALEGLLVLAAALLALVRAVRRARRGLDDETAAALMAATWLLAPILFLLRHNVPNAPHYFTAVFPAPFILVGWLVGCLKVPPTRGRPLGSLLRAMTSRDTAARVVQGILLLLVLAIAVAQVYENVALLRFVLTHDTMRGYDTPLSYDVRAARTAVRLGEEMGGAEVILLSEGDEPRMYEMPGTADVLLPETPHRAVDIRTALVFPASPAVYWSTYEMTPGEELLTGFTPELSDARIPLREGRRSYRFYRWPGGAPELDGLQPLPSPARWANGARLIGYVAAGEYRPGGTLRWTLVWQPLGTPTEDVNYHWFNHLVDGAGQMWGQADGPSMLPGYWRAGDTVLNWFEISIPADAPPGDYAMRVGLYRFPGLENIAVLDAENGPGAEWIVIGSIPIER
ncbi:MAG: hypothetical protein JW900_01755 [Anaerolineae bacterium]|nr:hypothetical protein [Anaerolineae bacterium]